jgi:thymidine kinase
MSSLSMDMRDISASKFRGEVILFSAPMNGGKTEAMIAELRRAGFFGGNYIGYNHERNTREQDEIVVNGEKGLPGKTVGGIPSLRDDLEKRIDQIMSCEIGEQGTDGRIVINGVKHHKYKPIIAIGIDEINLFCITEEEASETVDFMKWCKNENIALYLSGLLYDFRHLNFGQVHSILPYVDIRVEKSPACMALSLGERCENTANHSQRLWSLEFAKEAGYESLLGNMRLFDYVDKDMKNTTNSYVPAPFFDETLRIEAERDKKVVYTPVCSGCSDLAFKEETFLVYESIVAGRNPETVLDNPVLTNGILSFLVHPMEGWAFFDEDKKIYSPKSYHRNKLGGFSL